MRYDRDFAEICTFLKRHGLTAHTSINGKTILRVKQNRLFSPVPSPQDPNKRSHRPPRGECGQTGSGKQSL